MWRGVKLRGERYEQVERLAVDEGRSVANMVDRLLGSALGERGAPEGFQPPQAAPRSSSDLVGPARPDPRRR